MIKILEQIDHEKLLETYNKIKDGITWADYTKCEQCSLQYKLGDDPWNSGVGRGKNQDQFYNNINPYFKDTIFEEVIEKFKLYRTRLMLVNGWSCYTMHRDQTPRVHIPLITNPGCYFVFKEGLVEHLPLGNVYWVDTTKFHTFMNCSEIPRLHLVGAIDN